jgi:PAS domain S-box-containing protein
MEQLLSQQIQAMRRRMQILYRSANGDLHSCDLLPRAFEELDYALEELQTLETEIYQQQMQLLDTREQLEAERQTYQELFEFAPASYLITTPEGVIRRANQAAATLFESVEKFMIGRSLALFVPDGERRAFRDRIMRLHTLDGIQEWQAYMQPWGGQAFDAMISVAVVRGKLGRPMTLRWIIKKSSRVSAEYVQLNGHNPEPARRAHTGNAKEYAAPE